MTVASQSSGRSTLERVTVGARSRQKQAPTETRAGGTARPELASILERGLVGRRTSRLGRNRAEPSRVVEKEITGQADVTVV
jgi:hypothetical protein